MNAAQSAAFQAGSGIPPGTLLNAIAAVVLVLVFVWVIWVSLGTLRAWQDGHVGVFDLEPLAAQAPTEDGLWYYEIGGAEPVSPPANTSVVSVTLGGSASLTWGHSCGKFDSVAAVTQRLDQIASGPEQMMDAMVNAATAAIASLPALILQRANPGLYDLFQNALLRAEATLELATRSQGLQREADHGIMAMRYITTAPDLAAKRMPTWPSSHRDVDQFLRRLPETNIPNGAGFSSAFAKRQRVHSRSMYALPRQSRRARRQDRRSVC